MIVDRDRGAKALLRAVQRPVRIKVGVLGKGSDAHGDGLTVADIATQHEFGIGVPRRSFIADWADESKPEALRKLKEIRPQDAQAPNRFGLWAQGQIQQRISNRISPPLSPITIARKGSDVPLIDTGQLRASITFEVERG